MHLSDDEVFFFLSFFGYRKSIHLFDEKFYFLDFFLKTFKKKLRFCKNFSNLKNFYSPAQHIYHCKVNTNTTVAHKTFLLLSRFNCLCFPLTNRFVENTPTLMWCLKYAYKQRWILRAATVNYSKDGRLASSSVGDNCLAKRNRI